MLSPELEKKLVELLDKTKDDCPECKGEKTVIIQSRSFTCAYCHGTGKVGNWHSERLVVLDKNQSLPEGLGHCMEGMEKR